MVYRHTDSLSFRSLLPWIAVLSILGMLPYLIAWVLTPEGKIFTWALVNPDDTGVYLSALRQGMAGQWLFHFSYSPEMIPPLPLEYLPYLTVGHLVAGGHPITVFHVFRMICGILGAVALWLWIRCILIGRVQQLFAWLLILVGSGLGFFVVAIWGENIVSTPDLSLPEMTFMNSFLAAPHFVMAVGLEALLMASFLGLGSEKELHWSLPVGIISGSLLGLFYPFIIPVAGLVIALATLTRLKKDFSWGQFARSSMLVLPLVFFMIYYGWITRIMNPLWSQLHVSGNVIEPISLPSLIVGYGLLAILAVIGLWRWIRLGRDMLLPIWLVVNIIVLYLPFPYAGRFMLGLIVPVATLAAFGFNEVVIPLLSGRRWLIWLNQAVPSLPNFLRRMLLILCIPSTLVVLLTSGRSAASMNSAPFYLPVSDYKAAAAVAVESSPDDVILVYYPMGNYLPGVSSARVFVGQKFLTIDLEEKLALVKRFWSTETTDSWREEFLRDWGITLIYRGSYERALSGVELITPPGASAIYSEDGVTLYRVED